LTRGNPEAVAARQKVGKRPTGPSRGYAGNIIIPSPIEPVGDDLSELLGIELFDGEVRDGYGRNTSTPSAFAGSIPASMIALSLA